MNFTKLILGTAWSAIFAISTIQMPLMAHHHNCSTSSHHEKTEKKKKNKKNKKYDYVIVGCGSAGSILARKLSDNNKKSVLVLEAGINRNNDPLILASYSSPDIITDLWIITNDPQYAKSYNIRVNAPFQTTTYTEGENWGGSATHNYMVAVRGTPDIYDTWAAISGNSQWSYDNMLPLMKALETYNPCGAFDPTQRGSTGPISLTQNPSVLTDPLSNELASATTVGFIDDYNDPNDLSTTGHHYLGYSAIQAFATLGNPSCVPGNERGGIRSFSSREFLPTSIVSKKGKGKNGRKLTIKSNAWANKVLFKKKKAIGVQFVVTVDGIEESFVAYGKQIILCAGAINSPAILERSGIGDPAVLEPLGIPVLVNNPNVGNNLLNQYGLQGVVAATTTAFANQAWWNLAQNPDKPPFAPVYFYPNDDTRRIQGNLLPFGPGVTGMDFFILEPKSIGSTHIVSSNPLIEPFINLNMYSDGSYLTNGTDANEIVTAANLIASGVGVDNMLSPPAALFSNPPGSDPAADAALFDFLSTSGEGLIVTNHIVATTRMGTSIANGAVVDGNLNVIGVNHLKIADIGVLPKLTNGNTGEAAYLVAYRASTILGVPVPPAE